MEAKELLGIAAAILSILCLGSIAYFMFFGRKEQEVKSLLQATRGAGFGTARETRAALAEDESGEEYERLKKIQRRNMQKKKNQVVPKDELYFHAGIFSPKEKQEFDLLTKLLPVACTPAFAFIMWTLSGTTMITVLGAIIGLLIGLKAPTSILERKIARRSDDIMFYLPLVIEQIAIGVSSSLDIGPCLQRVVQMADERDSHNVVTELIRHAEYHIKSGISLEEALTEIGTKSGHNELKHSFIALSQVAKHGGEISKQLQELSEAVSGQRETKIEEKIKKLELEATGPVALVFMGFILILLIGFGIQIKDSFM